MSEPEAASNPKAANPPSVKFAFENSPFYRTIHADGAWAAVDPWSNVHLAFFTEKPPRPKSGVMEFAPNGIWTINPDRVEMGTDASWIREVDVDVTMSLPVATMVHDVLGRFIEMAKAPAKQMQPKL